LHSCDSLGFDFFSHRQELEPVVFPTMRMPVLNNAIFICIIAAARSGIEFAEYRFSGIELKKGGPGGNKMNALRETFQDPALVTTVGDLVTAVVDASLEVVDDETEAYRIAELVLNNMLRLTSSRSLLFDGRYAGRLVREA
jgi:hypothetical protein